MLFSLGNEEMFDALFINSILWIFKFFLHLIMIFASAIQRKISANFKSMKFNFANSCKVDK